MADANAEIFSPPDRESTLWRQVFRQAPTVRATTGGVDSTSEQLDRIEAKLDLLLLSPEVRSVVAPMIARLFGARLREGGSDAK